MNMYTSMVTLTHSVRALCKLIKGEFPVRHPSDYISSTDKKVYSFVKPTLGGTRTKICIVLNIGITSRESFMLFQEAVPNSIIFDTVFSGINIQSLEHCALSETLHFFSGPNYDSIILDPSLFNSEIYLADSCGVPRLRRDGCLCLNTQAAFLPSEMCKILLSKILGNCSSSSISLVLTQYRSDILSALLLLPSVRLRAVRIIPLVDPPIQTMTEGVGALCKVLNENEGILEYLQLDRFSVTFVPMLSLEKCINLRVLNITQRRDKGVLLKHMRSSVIRLFNSLQKLQNLEYFEWCDDVNLVNKDLISMKNALTNFLPNLLHWHLRCCRIMLFRSDLTSSNDEEGTTELLRQLMGDKTGDESCDTYLFPIRNIHFVNWLEIARPNVCFNCLKGAN